jgi:hypothetical protein
VYAMTASTPGSRVSKIFYNNCTGSDTYDSPAAYFPGEFFRRYFTTVFQRGQRTAIHSLIKAGNSEFFLSAASADKNPELLQSSQFLFCLFFLLLFYHIHYCAYRSGQGIDLDRTPFVS